VPSLTSNKCSPYATNSVNNRPIISNLGVYQIGIITLMTSQEYTLIIDRRCVASAGDMMRETRVNGRIR